MSEEKKNIHQRLLAIQTGVKKVKKDLEVQTSQNKSYKAASIEVIFDEVKPLEDEHGVYSYPTNREIIETKEAKTRSGGTMQVIFMKTTFRAVNVDDPKDFVETESFSRGMDTQDKAEGKAQTYGDKGAIKSLYKISTGDDPDAHSSHEHYADEKPKVNTDEAVKKLKTWVKEKAGDKAPEVEKSAMTNLGIEKWSDIEWGDNQSKKAVFDELKDEIEKIKTNQEAEGLLDD